jgi:hypothetical protein
VAHTPTFIIKGKGAVFAVQVIKVYGGVEIQFHSFLLLALEGDQWLASGSCLLCLAKRIPSAHCLYSRQTYGNAASMHAIKTCKWSRGTAPLILRPDLGTSWRWVARFTSQPLCPQERIPVPTEYNYVGPTTRPMGPITRPYGPQYKTVWSPVQATVGPQYKAVWAQVQDRMGPSTRLCGFQKRSGRFGKEKIPCTCRESKLRSSSSHQIGDSMIKNTLWPANPNRISK